MSYNRGMSFQGVTGGAEPGMLRVAAWARYPWLRAGFSTRMGGASTVYGTAEQNLGWTAEDDPAVVGVNRQRFAQVLADGGQVQMVTVRQVHGSVVRVLEEEPAPWRSAEGKAVLEGDGLTVGRPGVMLAVLTADCVPVLLADTRTHAVAALHAGWRGTLAGIVGAGVARMRAMYGSRPEDLVAAIGPCIRRCCFEVGMEVRERFASEFPQQDGLFTGAGRNGRTHLDLVAANREQLVAAGVGLEQMAVVGGCTACSRTEDGRRTFFSYRAEDGRTGRMLSGIVAIA